MFIQFPAIRLQKLLPECRNVTKQNCVTLWETDEAGAQQWAGTDRWALCLQMI